MKYIKATSKKDGDFRIPVLDVRENSDERKVVLQMVKASNGNNSKYVPGKYGYGTFGPKKY